MVKQNDLYNTNSEIYQKLFYVYGPLFIYVSCELEEYVCTYCTVRKLQIDSFIQNSKL